MYWLTIVFSVASVSLITLGITEIIPIKYVGYWLILGLIITGKFLKQINKVAQITEKAKDTFRQYALLLKQIEDTNFE